MQITKATLNQIIQEELDAVLMEVNPLKFIKFLKRGKKAKKLPSVAATAPGAVMKRNLLAINMQNASRLFAKLDKKAAYIKKLEDDLNVYYFKAREWRKRIMGSSMEASRRWMIKQTDDALLRSGWPAEVGPLKTKLIRTSSDYVMQVNKLLDMGMKGGMSYENPILRRLWHNRKEHGEFLAISQRWIKRGPEPDAAVRLYGGGPMPGDLESIHKFKSFLKDFQSMLSKKAQHGLSLVDTPAHQGALSISKQDGGLSILPN